MLCYCSAVGPPVKSRRYVSPRREAQAAETRRMIMEAARKLFVEGGYAATTVPSIAEEAGVSVKTVSLGFESKAVLLRSLWEARLGGSEKAVPVLERGWFRDLTAEPEPAEKL